MEAIDIPITTDANGHVFLELLAINEEAIDKLELDAPLTHALIVVTHQERFLLMFNMYRNAWELPGGVIEVGETPRACARRELLEETNQTAAKMVFKGLMKFHLQTDFHGPERIEYGALYAATVDEIAAFHENEEAARIVWWDGASAIGDINEIDRKLTEYA